MPKITELYRRVLRNQTLTDQEWQELLRERCQTIKPFMDRMTLMQLGSFSFRRNDLGGDLSLNDFLDSPAMRDSTVNREMTGIFMRVEARKAKTCQDRAILGYTRGGMWLVVRIRTETVDFHFTVTEITYTCPVNPEDIVNDFYASYYQLWQLLGNVATGWLERAKKRLTELEQLNEQIQLERLLIGTLESPL
ncbi:hypothetical protein EXS71_03505 [Candidatus Uhrbacteria bacterium]|nr:hypothetical protein [Candidatus Uhrbacteria bacterium]